MSSFGGNDSFCAKLTCSFSFVKQLLQRQSKSDCSKNTFVASDNLTSAHWQRLILPTEHSNVRWHFGHIFSSCLPCIVQLKIRNLESKAQIKQKIAPWRCVKPNRLIIGIPNILYFETDARATFAHFLIVIKMNI